MKQIGKLHILTDTVLQSRFSHMEITRFAIAEERIPSNTGRKVGLLGR